MQRAVAGDEQVNRRPFALSAASAAISDAWSLTGTSRPAVPITTSLPENRERCPRLSRDSGVKRAVSTPLRMTRIRAVRNPPRRHPFREPGGPDRTPSAGARATAASQVARPQLHRPVLAVDRRAALVRVAPPRTPRPVCPSCACGRCPAVRVRKRRTSCATNFGSLPSRRSNSNRDTPGVAVP